MNKKGWKCLTMVAIAVLLIVAIGIWCFPKHYEPVAIVEDIRFGMLPHEVRARCGKPDDQEKSMVAPEITYSYCGDFDGMPAKYYYTFVRGLFRYELSGVSVWIETSEAELPEVYNQLVETARENYQTLGGYYENFDTDCARLGINQGAVGVSFGIRTEQTAVVATVTRIW